MTQAQLKEQFLQYAENNLTDISKIECMIEILDQLFNQLYENGYIKEANRLNTAEQILMEVLKNA